MGMNDTNRLAHTKWNCKYDIVFAPRYRRKVFFGEKRREIGKNSATVVRMEKGDDRRGGGMSGSHTYAS